MARQASAREIAHILRSQASDVLEHVSVFPVNMMFPTDGKGPRIRLSVKQGQEALAPSSIDIQLGPEVVTIPIETIGDYQEFVFH